MSTLVEKLDRDIVNMTLKRDAHRELAILATPGIRKIKHVSNARFFSGIRRGLMIAKTRVN